MTEKEQKREVEVLRKKIQSLTEENEVLTEQAEDIYLLGIISEKMGLESSVEGVTAIALESISTLKDIYYCAFIAIEKDVITIVHDFCPDLPHSLSGSSYPLSHELKVHLDEKRYYVEIPHEETLPPFIPQTERGARPNAYCLSPIAVSQEPYGYYLCVNNIEKSQYTEGLTPLLDRIADMTGPRIETLLILDRMRELNKSLESKVSERTARLQEVNEKLRRENRVREKAEKALRESEAKQKAIIHALPDMMFRLSGEGIHIDYYAPEQDQLFVQANDFLGKSVHETLPEEVAEKYGTHIKQALDSGEMQVFEYELPFSEKGSQVYEARMVVSGENETLTIVRNITERKKSQEALTESEERYRTSIEYSNDGFAFSENGLLLYFNKRFMEIFGYDTPDEVDGKSISMFVHPDERERVLDIFTKRQTEKSVPSRFEFRGIRKDRSIVHIEASSAQTPYHGKLVNLAYLRDVTDRINLESQLVHSQKLEAVGQLAGGVAHEFNNILSAIINNIYLLKKISRDNKEFARTLDKISTLSINAASITQELLTFSREQHFDFTPLKLNDVIKDTNTLLSKLIRENIEFSTNLTSKDPFIMADKIKMNQILMNLITNAADAMPHGGRLAIESDVIEMDRKFIREQGFGKQGAYVRLSVTDSGSGMDEKVKEKVFEPFFTTKEVGRGTGLGLSIVYGIVKEHGGYVVADSKPGEGSIFTIYLPEIKGSVKEKKEHTFLHLKGNKEIILLAEDESSVRESIKTILEEFNYDVIEAADGKEAVDKFLQRKDEIRLAIVDVIMPKMNGKELYEKILHLKPETGVIFTSGYTDDVLKREQFPGGKLTFVAKPIDPETFLLKIKEVLAE